MTRIGCIIRAVWLELLRKKDIYVLLILLGALLVTLVSLNIFGLGGLVTYVKDVGFFMAWLFAWIVIAVIATWPRFPRQTIPQFLSEAGETLQRESKEAQSLADEPDATSTTG